MFFDRMSMLYDNSRLQSGAIMDWSGYKYCGVSIEPALQKKLKDYLRSGQHTSMPVLDVGCGAGVFSEKFSGKYNSGVVGVDIAKSLKNEQVDVCALSWHLPFADSSFGTVFCKDVLPHIPRVGLKPMLLEFTRVLAENGQIILISSEKCRDGENQFPLDSRYLFDLADIMHMKVVERSIWTPKNNKIDWYPHEPRMFVVFKKS